MWLAVDVQFTVCLVKRSVGVSPGRHRRCLLGSIFGALAIRFFAPPPIVNCTCQLPGRLSLLGTNAAFRWRKIRTESTAYYVLDTVFRYG